MPLLRCPKEEWLLQYVSIPGDVPVARRLKIRFHVKSCPACTEKKARISERLEALFTPPEITSSLLKVYSRLQHDETLILKGWKLGEPLAARRRRNNVLANGWAFRGAVAVGLGALMVILFAADRGDQEVKSFERLAAQNGRDVPFAQIRFQDERRVQVHYIKPELVKSVEFETTGTR